MTEARTQFDWNEIRRRIADADEGLSRALDFADGRGEEIFKQRAQWLAKRGETRRTDKELRPYLEFVVGGERYLLALPALIAILKPRELGVVPQAQSALAGTLFERGAIWSVFSLRAVLQLESAAPAGGDQGRVILMRDERCNVAFQVDEVSRVRRFDPANLDTDGYGSRRDSVLCGVLDGELAVLDPVALIHRFYRAGVH